MINMDAPHHLQLRREHMQLCTVELRTRQGEVVDGTRREAALDRLCAVVAEMMDAGHPQKQSVAASLRNARQGKKRHKRGGRRRAR